MASLREQFMEEGKGYLDLVLNNMQHTAQCLLDDVLQGFPFEKAWSDRSGVHTKTIATDYAFQLGRLYAILEILVALGVRYGLEIDYRIKELKKKRVIDFRIRGMILQKDCKSCASCSK